MNFVPRVCLRYVVEPIFKQPEVRKRKNKITGGGNSCRWLVLEEEFYNVFRRGNVYPRVSEIDNIVKPVYGDGVSGPRDVIQRSNGAR